MNISLAEAMQRDDDLEDAGMPAADRITCFLHQSFTEDCLDEHGLTFEPVLFYRLREDLYA